MVAAAVAAATAPAADATGWAAAPAAAPAAMAAVVGGIGGRRRWGRQRLRWLDGITDSMDMSLSELRVLHSV